MQYDIYTNPSAKSQFDIPYVVDIQSDFLSDLNTRMVVPLVAMAKHPTKIPQRLCPVIPVAGKNFMLLPYQAAPLLKTQLQDKVDSAQLYAHAIVDALDAVMSGF